MNDTDSITISNLIIKVTLSEHLTEEEGKTYYTYNFY